MEDRIAHGKVATVYRAVFEDRPVALKIFRPRSIERHARRHPLGIAEFEFRRNARFHETPGLSRYVARPLGFLQTPGTCAVLQEFIVGEAYLEAARRRGGPLDEVFEHLRRVVALAHAADLYDLDLHPMNVLVVRDGDEEIPRLFDFNRIPFYEHPRNPIEALGLKLGLIDRGSRDRRKLRQFHDFGRLAHRAEPGFGAG